MRGSTFSILHRGASSTWKGSAKSGSVFTLAQSRPGDVWIGTDAGLSLWHADTRTLTPFGPLRRGFVQITRVLEDQSGAVWVGSFDAGLHAPRSRGPGAGERSGTIRATPASLSSNDVRALLEDQDGHFWVGTAEGLDLLDRTSGEIRRYQHDANDADSLRDSFVMSLYQDQAGLVWIGTRVRRREPLESAQLAARRPSARVAGKRFGHRVRRRRRQPGLDCLAGRGLVRFNADTGAATSRSTTSSGARTRSAIRA